MSYPRKGLEMRTTKQLILQAQMISSDKHRKAWVEALEPAEAELLWDEIIKLGIRLARVFEALPMPEPAPRQPALDADA